MKSPRDSDALQVGDDPETLALMLRDLEAAPEEFQLTNYWKRYSYGVLETLRQHGLRDFRRRHDSVIEAFGAVDVVEPIAELTPLALRRRWLVNRVTRSIPGFVRLLDRLTAMLARYATVSVRYHLTPSVLRQLYFGYAAYAARRAPNARWLGEIGMSRLGNPQDVFDAEGNEYSLSFVQQYLRYAFACRFIDFDGISIFAELGSGNGKLVELVHKLHPRVTILVFDISPQLYFANQYLLSVFPGDVVGYRDTRQMPRLDRLEPGKIYVLPNHRFSLLSDTPVDLFWNAASFQEMEPDVVEHYLRVAKTSAKNVFLHELMEGMSVASRPGDKGVMAPTTLAHYRRYLEGFRLLACEPALPSPDYQDSFWTRA